MGNIFHKRKIFNYLENKMYIKAKCNDCKTWHKKMCTFRGKNGKRYCASCVPSDMFEKHIQYNASNDYTTLLP